MASIFQRCAAPVLLAQLGETITYTPAGGAPLSIPAVVHRDPLEVPGLEGALPAYPVSVLVSAADVPSVTVHGDTVAVRRRAGDASATTLRVGRIVEQSGGCWLLGLVG